MIKYLQLLNYTYTKMKIWMKETPNSGFFVQTLRRWLVNKLVGWDGTPIPGPFTFLKKQGQMGVKKKFGKTKERISIFSEKKTSVF